MRKIQVLIIDDSALMRELLAEILGSDPEIEVVGTAADAVIGWERIKATRPDVVTLDVEMPRLHGIKFLEMLMAHHPLPVVMVSSLTERGCQVTLRALELGAFDFVTKPRIDMHAGTVALGDELCAKVKAAAQARPRPQTAPAPPRPPRPLELRSAPLKGRGGPRVIAIGASTGGTEAVRELLVQFPPDAAGTVVVLHMPEKFTTSYAARLDRLCRVRVKEASDGDRVLAGQVLIAPGNFHLELVRKDPFILTRVFQSAPVNGHRPSVNVLFESCARSLGPNGVGVILTGMGSDGARGLLALRTAGGRTIAQNESSCVVFGMPREAIACGAADDVLPLEDIAAAALRLSTSG